MRRVESWLLVLLTIRTLSLLLAIRALILLLAESIILRITSTEIGWRSREPGSDRHLLQSLYSLKVLFLDFRKSILMCFFAAWNIRSKRTPKKWFWRWTFEVCICRSELSGCDYREILPSKVMKMRDIKRTCMFLNFFFFSWNLNFPEFLNSFRQEQYMAILEIELCWRVTWNSSVSGDHVSERPASLGLSSWRTLSSWTHGSWRWISIQRGQAVSVWRL